ncbi:MAG: hypothetical protein O3B42_02620 [Actinomycetota bacterium]|nr:hypothetical protein [Actinomycetota bacterium]
MPCWILERPHTDDSARRIRLFIVSIGACLGASVFALIAAQLDGIRVVLIGDISLYSDIAAAVLNGEMPYIDLPVEHLPLSLLTIVVLGWFAEVLGVGLLAVWMPATTAAFVATAQLVDRLEPTNRGGFRFVAVSLPMLPLVLFRLEPWVVLFVALALVAYVANRYALGGVWTFAGILAKGWPMALALIPWSKERRRSALILVGLSGVALAAVALTPGFQASREFEGIHTETVVGSLTLLWRSITGAGLDLQGSAGAVYVTAPGVLAALNAVPGIAILIVGAVVARSRRLGFADLVALSGFVVLGVMLISPLFSTQFIFWLAPFVVVLGHKPRLIYAAAGVFGLLSVTDFDPTSLLWILEVVAKNGAILLLAVVWTGHLLALDGTPASNTSRKNLPV